VAQGNHEGKNIKRGLDNPGSETVGGLGGGRDGRSDANQRVWGLRGLAEELQDETREPRKRKNKRVEYCSLNSVNLKF
jgi:hypothetical protein